MTQGAGHLLKRGNSGQLCLFGVAPGPVLRYNVGAAFDVLHLLSSKVPDDNDEKSKAARPPQLRKVAGASF